MLHRNPMHLFLSFSFLSFFWEKNILFFCGQNIYTIKLYICALFYFFFYSKKHSIRGHAYPFAPKKKLYDDRSHNCDDGDADAAFFSWISPNIDVILVCGGMHVSHIFWWNQRFLSVLYFFFLDIVLYTFKILLHKSSFFCFLYIYFFSFVLWCLVYVFFLKKI